ncbi:NPCBM/NEW2 domain-containing protein [Mobilicoccus sp.]|uniref:NPCBM/NEW2 domain-containing protein n=1 Tax=Mobilicoccus sp. TaxID=2034349 RepID=UPI0028AC4FD9|nr:NPCBM/NEW2 domain-containing protein [Mobilicoccus sp.]
MSPRLLSLAVPTALALGAVLAPIPAASAAPGPSTTTVDATAFAPPRTGRATLSVPRRVEAGKPFTVSGRAPLKTRVTIQALQGRKWVAVRPSVGVSRNGTYSASVRLTTAGSVTLRAVATGPTPATSSGVRTAVFAWFDVAATEPTLTYNVRYGGAVPVNGRVYPLSIAQDYGGSRGSSAAWNVNRVCTTLRTTVGVRDDDSSAAVGRVEVWADDAIVIDEPVRFGASKAMSVDISGALRLTFVTYRTEAYVRPVFGRPQILCSRNPFE